MAVKFETYTKEINGKKYVAQFSGLSLALRAIDETYIDGTTTPSVLKKAQFLLDNVIVDPKGLTVDGFENAHELTEVTTFAQAVMEHEFRPEENEGTAKTTRKG